MNGLRDPRKAVNGLDLKISIKTNTRIKGRQEIVAIRTHLRRRVNRQVRRAAQLVKTCGRWVKRSNRLKTVPCISVILRKIPGVVMIEVG